MERLELLQRQIGELAAVQAMFVEPGEFVLEGSELRALEIAQQLTQGDAEESSPNQGLQLGGQVTLLNLQLNGSPVGLHFTLPPAYPLVAPQLQVQCAGSREILEKLTQAVLSAVAELGPGEECLLLCTDSLHTEATKLMEAQAVESSGPGHQKPTMVCATLRSLIWFHHIKSLTKRKNIISWARELHIGGYCKPGFPGIIVCEGAEDDVTEYVSRIRQMRWQAMSVRAEQRDPPHDSEHSQASSSEKQQDRSEDPARSEELRLGQAQRPAEVSSGGVRLFADAFTELDERGMDDLASACQAAGLGQLFLTAMKLHK